MSQTDQAFQDGLALDLFSPKNRTLTIQQNMSPLPAHFVSRTTGESWVALKNYSYIVKMNETAHDLVAEIEVSFNSSTLAALGVQKCNTFVGKLASDGQSWVVDNATRNVHKSENKTRIVNMTSLDGEYMLLGRQTIDAGSIFIQYGQGIARTLNVSGDNGIQSGDFVDGLNILIRSETALAVNVDLVNGINPGTLPANTLSLNPYAWVVNTSNPKANVMAEMHFPCECDPSARQTSHRLSFSSAYSSSSADKLQPHTLATTITPSRHRQNSWLSLYLPSRTYKLSDNRALLPNNTDFTNISSVLTLARRPLNATTGQFLALNAAQQVQDIGAGTYIHNHSPMSRLRKQYLRTKHSSKEPRGRRLLGNLDTHKFRGSGGIPQRARTYSHGF